MNYTIEDVKSAGTYFLELYNLDNLGAFASTITSTEYLSIYFGAPNSWVGYISVDYSECETLAEVFDSIKDRFVEKVRTLNVEERFNDYAKFHEKPFDLLKELQEDKLYFDNIAEDFSKRKQGNVLSLVDIYDNLGISGECRQYLELIVTLGDIEGITDVCFTSDIGNHIDISPDWIHTIIAWYDVSYKVI